MLKSRHVEELPDPSALIVSLLRDGIGVSFEAHGSSMLPTILAGDKLVVRPAGFFVKNGEVVLTHTDRGLMAHRVVRIERKGQRTFVVTRGDNCTQEDSPVAFSQLLGHVVEVSRSGRLVSIDRRSRPRTLLWRLARRLRSIARAVIR